MLYKHYYYFVTEFSLVTQRELDALVNLLFFIILSRSSPDSLVYWPLILEAVKLQFTQYRFSKGTALIKWIIFKGKYLRGKTYLIFWEPILNLANYFMRPLSGSP